MNNFSNDLIAQLFAENSDDPFLALFSISHPTWVDTIYLVNNTVSITSNGQTFEPFPIRLKLPSDDGETIRKVEIEFDNVSLELIEEIRTITDDKMEVKIEMVLASNPDLVEFELAELIIKNISYNEKTIRATLYMDDFLNTEMPSEKYSPTLYPGLYN